MIAPNRAQKLSPDFKINTGGAGYGAELILKKRQQISRSSMITDS
jgi:hypothetical protein